VSESIRKTWDRRGDYKRGPAMLMRRDGLLWALCRVRKPVECCRTGRPIRVGDLAYRPVSNCSRRMLRMLPPKGGPA
jgi:hypothetical protein